MYKIRRNGRKSPKNRKLHLKCGGLRWSQNRKIIFPPCLYVGMTSKFTWGLKIHILFPPLIIALWNKKSNDCIFKMSNPMNALWLFKWNAMIKWIHQNTWGASCPDSCDFFSCTDDWRHWGASGFSPVQCRHSGHHGNLKKKKKFQYKEYLALI